MFQIVILFNMIQSSLIYLTNDNINTQSISSSSLTQYYQFIFGVESKIDESSQNLINSQQNNFMNQVKFNFLFNVMYNDKVNVDNVQLNQEEFKSKSDFTINSQFYESIYGIQNQDSLFNQLDQTEYSTFYIYQPEFTQLTKQFGVQLQINEQKIQLFDHLIQQKVSNQISFDQCIKQLQQQKDFILQNKEINYKGDKFQMTDEIKQIFQQLCGISLFNKQFYNYNHAHMILYEIDLSAIEQNTQQFDLVNKLLSNQMNQTKQYFDKIMSVNQGQAILINKNQMKTIQNQKIGDQTHVVYKQIRLLQQTKSNRGRLVAYQIKVWAGLIIFILMFVAVLAVANMQIQKDTILESKFIVNQN